MSIPPQNISQSGPVEIRLSFKESLDPVLMLLRNAEAAYQEAPQLSADELIDLENSITTTTASTLFGIYARLCRVMNDIDSMALDEPLSDVQQEYLHATRRDLAALLSLTEAEGRHARLSAADNSQSS